MTEEYTPYRPSNGCEGDAFINHFCGRCKKDGECDIVIRSMDYDIGDKEYPVEWVRRGMATACLGFEQVIHDIKIAPQFFDDVATGIKPFEIRFDDRNYRNGEQVLMREYRDDEYTGREITATISYVTDFAQHDNWVVFGLRNIETQNHSVKPNDMINSEEKQ